MALQIWLPLDGDLRNQGFYPVETITNSGMTVDNSGKIGKCYSNANSKKLSFTIPNFSTGSWSLVAWFYPIASSSSGHQYIVGMNTSTANDFTGVLCFYADKIGIRTGGTTYSGDAADLNQWHHGVATYDYNTKTLKLYHNGNLVLTQTNPATPVAATTCYIGVRGNTAGAFTGKINDVRIYDHALSYKEVKELSKGLILHYPMNENLTILNNCYSQPFFNTSTAAGGWSHWGGSGHQGTYGQNTDKNYIFNKEQTYSHWIADASGATKPYLVYQSPSFSGGYRSIQFIIKEENSLPITEIICYPAWNARDGGVPSNLWTSIEYLGDGFYLCKCEGIHQDGSNNLIGVNVQAGYKIYISEAYLENDQEICSYIRSIDNTTVIDCAPAGNENDGTITGTITAAADSPRYEISYHYNGSSYIKRVSPFGEIKTISLWVKWDSIPSGQSVVFVDYKSYFGFGLMSSGILCGSRSNVKVFNKSNLAANTWYHFVIIAPNGGSNSERKLYINGEEQTALTATSNWSYSIDELQVGKRSSTSDGFVGKISDFRVYCTALSAEDILELYNTAAQIDKDGNTYAYEFKEA